MVLTRVLHQAGSEWLRLQRLLLILVVAQVLLIPTHSWANELAPDFNRAKSIATNASSASGKQPFTTDILLPYFTDTFTPVLDTCFEALDDPDDAKFEIVIALDDNGRVSKVYRDLDTNLGSCLFAEMENTVFPRPPSAPYYFHQLLDKLAGNFTCPYDTIRNEESKPQLTVAWCEVQINGQTVFHGPYRAWWPNGRLGNEAHYEYGVPVGLWRGWYESGVLQGSNLYENGIVVQRERYPDQK